MVALRYRSHPEAGQLTPRTNNLRLGAVRRLAYEAADCGPLQRRLGSGYPPRQRSEKAGCTTGKLAAPEGTCSVTYWRVRRHATDLH